MMDGWHYHILLKLFAFAQKQATEDFWLQKKTLKSPLKKQVLSTDCGSRVNNKTDNDN